MIKKSSLVLFFIGIIFSMTFLSSINSNPNYQKVSAHIFTTDETASFIAFADQLQVESELVHTNLVNNNLSLAQEHAIKAASLLTPTLTMMGITEDNQRIANDLITTTNDLQKITSSSEKQRQMVNQLVHEINATLSEAVTMRIEQGQGQGQDSSNFLEKGIEFLRGILVGSDGGEGVDDRVDRNNRIKPLAFADLVDSILINYGNAYAVDFDMTDMSNMVVMGGNSSMAMSGLSNGDNNNSSNNMSSTNTSSTMMNMDSKINKNYSLVNMTDFQSAQALATRASGIFDTELRPMVPKNESNFANSLERGLTQLNDLVRNKASPMDITMVVHSQIHPNLLEAFNLQLR